MTFTAAKWLDLDEFMIFVARRIQQSNGGQHRSHLHDSQPIISAPIIKREPAPDSLLASLDCAVPDNHVSACCQKRKIPSLAGGKSSAQSRDLTSKAALPLQSPEVIEISDSEESNLPPKPLVHSTQMKEDRKCKRAAKNPGGSGRDSAVNANK